MAALMPRLFGDVADWYQTDFPHYPFLLHGDLIRVEDRRSEKQYTLQAELPGVDPDQDVQLSVDDGVMTVQAERREPEPAYGRSEFKYGRLHRSVRLPAGADTEHITATYDKGVLHVSVPLTAPQPAGRKIPVTAIG
jgi:HSP20 family molecular chaperone IbpA